MANSDVIRLQRMVAEYEGSWHFANLLRSLLLAALLTACGHTSQQGMSDSEQDVAIRELVLSFSPELSAAEGISGAESLVSFVHFHTHIMGGNELFGVVDRATNLRLTLEDPEHYGHICGGMGVTAVDVLRAFGYHARIVQLQSPGINGHVTAEVLIAGAWLALDPTFNARFLDDSGARIGYTEMFARQAAGLPFHYEYIGGKTQDRMYDATNPILGYYDYTTDIWRGRLMPEYSRILPALAVKVTGEELLTTGAP